jgi:hypothetical protein
MNTLYVEIVGTILVPAFLFWIDMRFRSNRDLKEMRDLVLRIDTKLEPIWKWFNEERDRRRNIA